MRQRHWRDRPPDTHARQMMQRVSDDVAPAAAAVVPTGQHAVPLRSFLGPLVVSLRPGQWTKNLIVFAALIFGLRLFDLPAVAAAMTAFLVFCALSSAVYLLNDVMDREADRRHPLKATRPIAAGALPCPVALAAAALLAVAGLAVAYWLTPVFAGIAGIYVLLVAAYSGPLKHIVILDVLTIAAGFVLRAIAGAVVVNVPFSQWLLICTILLALFLALSKRRHELVLLADDATQHRRSLEEYSPYLLDQMTGVVTASTLMAYILYTLSPETTEKFASGLMPLTIPFPLYGIFRYLYLVHQRAAGGSPAETLLTDRPLLICIALWAAAVVVVIYHPLGL